MLGVNASAGLPATNPLVRLRHLVPAVLGCAALCAPGTATALAPNPCLDAERRASLLCPDLVMKQPFGLQLDREVKRGRVVLRAGNSIDNVGLGPAELHGTRISKYLMRGRQRIHRRLGGRLGIFTGARLFFKFVPGQLRYWKFHNAAAFELWRLNAQGERTRLARRGPKVSYCLRDLSHTRPSRIRSPRRFVYPACNTDPDQRRVTIGTSVGWSDVYPPSYPEQWVDVTGLRGCFAYRHIADPRNGIYESNERNNSASVTVRLPYRRGSERCAGPGSPPPEPSPPTSPDDGY